MEYGLHYIRPCLELICQCKAMTDASADVETLGQNSMVFFSGELRVQAKFL